MFLSQAHYFLNVFIFYIFLVNVVLGETDVENEEEKQTTIELANSYNPNQLPYGQNVSIICKTRYQGEIYWMEDNRAINITEDEGYILERESEHINKETGNKIEVSILHILHIDFKRVGTYICHVAYGDNELEFADIHLNVTLAARVMEHSPAVRTKPFQNATIYCIIEGYPLESLAWFKDGEQLTENVHVATVNETIKKLTLTVSNISKKDNGSYICSASTYNVTTSASMNVLVLDRPQIRIDMVKPIGTSKIYLNWTVDDGNSPETLSFQIQYQKAGEKNWYFHGATIKGDRTSYVLDEKDKETKYIIGMKAKNSEGTSQMAQTAIVTTLSEDPVFVPEVKINGYTYNSITISWTEPPEHLKDYVQYYELNAETSNGKDPLKAVSLLKDNLYMFSDLEAATKYNFSVRACSEYTNECGPWSEKVNGSTMDGVSGPPSNVTVECKFDTISYVSVFWTPPHNPQGTITSYNVHLEGNASFINDQGVLEHTTWGPKVTSVSENTLTARIYNISANTNYTVRVAGVTKAKRNGEYVEKHCTMPPTVPDKQKLSRISWKKIEEQGKWMFKLMLPRVSERNGPICCYRIYLVRMESMQTIAELPAPKELTIMSYQEAHRTPTGGAYVAEMFTSSMFHPEIFLGDEQVFNNTNSICNECVGLRPYSTPRKTPSSNETTNRVRREEELQEPLPPFDGTLDNDSNYTGFVEILVRNYDEIEPIAAYSSYFTMLNPGPEVVVAPSTSSISLFVQVMCGLVVVVLVLMIALCLLHQYTKQAHAQAVEMITFRTSLRNLRGRQRLVSLNPPDMCPIVTSDLAASYIERHRDSDYGFQQEFELLPDRFNDRTTRASDSRENVYKNRYPDIKAYDQTRVKLQQVDSIAGSDYINANYVLGYKERKKFICAQGPMDTTVDDFWRMIWEQHLELILMLTNLEEYSKTKCAKYWPDKAEIDKIFGDITVTHVQETRFSDYIVRDLTICRKGNEERKITQYHYLVWKDFMAPEHPHGIIKFIKRMNEAYSIERGCILVHCSAGVGRTGTLVALDCLLQQLKDEGQAAIFNTICDLRHQRNFLVQSLKQYIFIYRALMEVAQYGDTEIQASELKATVEKLKQVDNDKGKCKMEDDFEKIKNAYEDRKSCSVASGDENREKNRSDSILPYDRNRVILTPMPAKEHSTYINASFIEGYDNSESFIVTQDPMENTITDFWRMVAEQGISVIVMFSEVGEGKCPRYWPEDENATYDHISVRYFQAESCPYYTRREMYVKNRDGEELKVTHLQYHGWPTVDGEVPEVTRGLIEIVDYAQTALAQNGNHGTPTSTVVHCNLGSDRSSIFVGLSILVQQLRIERRVDIFTTTRKLRSQRQGMISTYAQYEFLHRAIVNYAELHGLCEW